MNEYHALQNFLAAYFHQDWQVEHDSADAVVAYYLDSEADEEIAEVRHDLARLSAQDFDDAALARQMQVLGCEYDPTRDGRDWRGWLQALLSRFA